MNDEYAVIRNHTIVYQTGGFAENLVTDRVPLSDGAELLVCARSRQLLEMQLKEAEEAIAAKDTFLSSMSHDIRTPMNAITGLTLLAKRHLDETPRVSDALNKIETASAHLLGLINDVLDMSRINSGKMQITPEPFSLGDLIHNVMVMVRPQAAKKKHTLALETVDIDQETLVGDRLRLQQIFVNIIGNAIKYTPEAGAIRVRFGQQVREQTCDLLFECQDNGIGMTPAFLEHIFEPFVRVESSTVSRIEGTGLGMSIVKKLTDAMNGQIHIQSVPGEGTTVVMRFPLPFRQEALHADALRGKRLLVLEADETLAHTYRRYLDDLKLDYRITVSAEDTLNALADASFSQKPVDILIIGNAIADGDDKLDIASYLHKAYPALPILLVSDADWSLISYRAEHCGIVSFIPLPLLRAGLINGLAAVMESPTAGESVSSMPDLQGRRILLVDDNMINREIAKEILGATNAIVDTAEDGQQALDMVLQQGDTPYAAVLMDVQMPVMDGYEATRRIRASAVENAQTLPIFAMTANTFAEDIAKARACGMNGHIAKPIDVNMLMQVLRGLTRPTEPPRG